MSHRTGGGGSVQHGHVPHLAADVVVALLLLLRPAPAHVGGELAALGRGPAQPAPVAVAGGGGGGGAVAGHVDGLVHRLTTSSSHSSARLDLCNTTHWLTIFLVLSTTITGSWKLGQISLM